MKKICEIDSVQVYADTGVMPWRNNPRYTCNRRRHSLEPKWFLAAFTPAQQTLLTKLEYRARPHPRDSPRVEIYINHYNCTEQDWTMLRLVF